MASIGIVVGVFVGVHQRWRSVGIVVGVNVRVAALLKCHLGYVKIPWCFGLIRFVPGVVGVVGEDRLGRLVAGVACRDHIGVVRWGILRLQYGSKYLGAMSGGIGAAERRLRTFGGDFPTVAMVVDRALRDSIVPTGVRFVPKEQSYPARLLMFRFAACERVCQ